MCTWWEHIDELVRLLLVFDNQRDQILWSAGLELHAVLVLLDLDGTSVLAVDDLEKLFDVANLLWLEGAGKVSKQRYKDGWMHDKAVSATICTILLREAAGDAGKFFILLAIMAVDITQTNEYKNVQQSAESITQLVAERLFTLSAGQRDIASGFAGILFLLDRAVNYGLSPIPFILEKSQRADRQYWNTSPLEAQVSRALLLHHLDMNLPGMPETKSKFVTFYKSDATLQAMASAILMSVAVRSSPRSIGADSRSFPSFDRRIHFKTIDDIEKLTCSLAEGLAGYLYLYRWLRYRFNSEELEGHVLKTLRLIMSKNWFGFFKWHHTLPVFDASGADDDCMNGPVGAMFQLLPYTRHPKQPLHRFQEGLLMHVQALSRCRRTPQQNHDVQGFLSLVPLLCRASRFSCHDSKRTRRIKRDLLARAVKIGGMLAGMVYLHERLSINVYLGYTWLYLYKRTGQQEYLERAIGVAYRILPAVVNYARSGRFGFAESIGTAICLLQDCSRPDLFVGFPLLDSIPYQ